MRFHLHIATTAALLALTGCASITDGTSQTIIFKLDPNETRCSIVRDGAELGSVNGRQNTITVSKGAKDIIVSCGAAGYAQKTQRLVSKTQTAGVVGGVFLDLGITDMITGAMWKYPTDITIVMEREGASGLVQAALPPAATATAAATAPSAVDHTQTAAAKPPTANPAQAVQLPVAVASAEPATEKTPKPPEAQPTAGRPLVGKGADARNAERTPEALACAEMPLASLVSKGPGFELYSVSCRNSETLMVRCDFGSCRALK